MDKIKRIRDFKNDEYIGISVVFVFSPESRYSKLSDDYSGKSRESLAETVKRDAERKTNSLFKGRAHPAYNWFDTEPEHLTAYPSVLEIGGAGMVREGASVNERELGKAARELNAELSDRMGKGTSCIVNFYIVKKGGEVLADDFRTR